MDRHYVSWSETAMWSSRSARWSTGAGRTIAAERQKLSIAGTFRSTRFAGRGATEPSAIRTSCRKREHRPRLAERGARRLQIQRINRALHVPEGELPQVTGTRAARGDRKMCSGDRVVDPAVGHGRFDPDHRQLFRLDSLAAPLPKVKRRRLAAREEDRDSLVPDDGARPHVELAAAHRRQMTVPIFESKAPVAA